MAETEVALPEIDSNALFRGAMDDPPPEVQETAPPEAEAKTENPDRPRDERGRFTSEATKADAAPTQQPAEEPKSEAKDEAYVPSWRVREYREDRDKAEARANEFARQAEAFQRELAETRRQFAEATKTKQEPVDFFADPNAAFKQQVSPIEERIGQVEANYNMKLSRITAIVEHGKEAVAEAEKAVAEAMRVNDPSIHSLRAQLANTDDPVGTAVRWHSSNRVMKETGGDIAKFREKILADAMKDPKFQAQVIEAAKGAVQANKQAPNINLPPSLNKVAGSGGNSEVAGDLSNDSLWAHARTGR